jgi:hypothetical protein
VGVYDRFAQGNIILFEQHTDVFREKDALLIYERKETNEFI